MQAWEWLARALIYRAGLALEKQANLKDLLSYRKTDLEARLTRNVEQLSSKFEERAERLDEFARREVEKLSEQLADERKAREEAGQQGSREFNELGQKLESWCTALEAQIGSETHDLRDLLKAQGEELSGVIHEAREELGKSFAAETRSLSNRKVAREDLASLLSEVAARLNKDPEPHDA